MPTLLPSVEACSRRSISSAPGFLLAAQAVVQQVVHHKSNGVHRTGGHGRMAALAESGNTSYAVRLGCNFHIFGVLQRGGVRAYQRISTVRTTLWATPP